MSSGVTWTGEVVPGKSVTFTGTVEQIQEQIIAVNPSYFDNANGTDVESGPTLAKRWVCITLHECGAISYFLSVISNQEI